MDRKGRLLEGDGSILGGGSKIEDLASDFNESMNELVD
jgi:hypothetical protein